MPLKKVLAPSSASVDIAAPLSKLEQQEHLLKGSPLSQDEYEALGTYLMSTERPYASMYLEADKTAATLDSRFLLPTVCKRTEVLLDGRTFSVRESHEGNSAIQYYNPTNQSLETGNIEMIWQQSLDERLHTFFVIRPHRPLSPVEERLAPFAQFHELYATRIFDSIPSNQLFIVEPQHIRTHLSTYRRPSGTYGIQKDTLVVCWALNRGRR